MLGCSNQRYENFDFIRRCLECITDETEMGIIRGAISHWEDNSCIRFEEVPMEQQIDEHHIVFTNAGRLVFGY